MRDTIEMLAKRGLGPAEMTEALLEAGWPRTRAERAVSAWAWTKHGPVPKPDRRAKSIVVGITALALLTFVSLNAVVLAFEMTDHLVHDPSLANEHWAWRSAMSWPAANLLVLCPLLALFLRRFSPVPGWSRVAATLLVGAVLTGDAITVLHGLLSGGAGLGFIIKAVIVAVVAALAGYAVRPDHEA